MRRVVVLAALLAGCGGDEERVLLLTGWDYEWETLSHRVAYLRADLAQDSSLGLGLVGGSFSTGEEGADVPHYRVRFADVTLPASALGEATVILDVPPEGSAEGEVTVPLPERRGRDGLVALVNGFWIDTDVPQGEDYPADYPARWGYTTQGFGVALGEVTEAADGASVPVSAQVRWAPQDRDDMNAAIPHAWTQVGVHVIVLATPAEVTEATATLSADYPFEPPYTEQPPMQGELGWDAAEPSGVAGWKAFDLRGEGVPTNPENGTGDYVRGLGAELIPVPESDALRAEVTAELSTTSLLELTEWTAGFTGTLVRIGDGSVSAAHYVVEGSHPVGEASTGPTLVPGE